MKTKAIINRTNKTITVPHSFLVAAGNIHSAEYQEYTESLPVKEQTTLFRLFYFREGKNLNFLGNDHNFPDEGRRKKQI